MNKMMKNEKVVGEVGRNVIHVELSSAYYDICKIDEEIGEELDYIVTLNVASKRDLSSHEKTINLEEKPKNDNKGFTQKPCVVTYDNTYQLADHVTVHMPRMALIFQDHRMVSFVPTFTKDSSLLTKDKKVNLGRCESFVRKLKKLYSHTDSQDPTCREQFIQRLALYIKGAIINENDLALLAIARMFFVDDASDVDTYMDVCLELFTAYNRQVCTLPYRFRSMRLDFIDVGEYNRIKGILRPSEIYEQIDNIQNINSFAVKPTEAAIEYMEVIEANPEMDITSKVTHDGDMSSMSVEISDTPEATQVGNVTLTDTSSTVANKAVKKVPKSLAKTKMSEVKDSGKKLEVQWLRFGKARAINTSDLANSIMFADDLPKDCVLQNLCSSVVRPMENHAYVKADLRVKIQINSTQFQQGIYVVGYRYFEQGSEREPIVHAAQVLTLNSTIMNLLNSNSCELTIPYISPMAAMPTRDSTLGYGLDMVTLYFACLDPLRTGANGQKKATLFFNMALENVEFIGKRHKQIISANPEMDSRKSYVMKPKLSKDVPTDVKKINVGEEHNMHNCLRRMALVSSGSFNLNSYSQSLVIPIKPTQLDLEKSPTFMNTVASGHRFYRGGIRYAIALKNYANTDIVAKVVHMPNCEVVPDDVNVEQYSPGGDEILYKGYANELQTYRINNIISVDIPYYNPNLCIINEMDSQVQNGIFTPNLSNMGVLQVVINNWSAPNSQSILIYDVYASVADGAQFYVFQGFPFYKQFNFKLQGISAKPFGRVNATLPPKITERLIGKTVLKRRSVIEAVPEMDIIGGAMEVLNLANEVGPLVEKVESLITTFMPGDNCDRPNNVVEGSYIIPRNVTSFANGDGMFNGYSMRIDPSKQVSMPKDMLPDTSDVTIQDMAKVRGLTGGFKFPVSKNVDDMLWQTPVNPMMFWIDVDDARLLTPISVVSSHFMMYTGGINLTFMAGLTKIHSGRLRIVYVPDPGNYDDNTIARDSCNAIVQPKNNYGIVWDLANNPEITFTIPDQVPYAGNMIQMRSPFLATPNPTIPAYGKVYVTVETELVAMESVPQDIHILVFASADKDFSVSTPVSTPLLRYGKEGSIKDPKRIIGLKVDVISKVVSETADRWDSTVTLESTIDIHETDSDQSTVVFTNTAKFEQELHWATNGQSLGMDWTSDNIPISEFPCIILDADGNIKTREGTYGKWKVQTRLIREDRTKMDVTNVSFQIFDKDNNMAWNYVMAQPSDNVKVPMPTGEYRDIKRVMYAIDWTAPAQNKDFHVGVKVANLYTAPRGTDSIRAVPEMNATPEGITDVLGYGATAAKGVIDAASSTVRSILPTNIYYAGVGRVAGGAGLAGYILGDIMSGLSKVVDIGIDASKAIIAFIKDQLDKIFKKISIKVDEGTKDKVLHAIIGLVKAFRCSSQTLMVELVSFVINVLYAVKVISLEMVLALETTLTMIYKKFLKNSIVPENFGGSANVKKDLIKNYLVAFGTVLSTYLGVKTNSSVDLGTTLYNIVDKLTSAKALTFANTMTAIMGVLEHIISYIVGDANAELVKLRELEAEEKGILEWGQEVLTLTDPEFRVTLMSSPEAQDRLKKVHMQSCQYFSKFAAIKDNNVTKLILFFHTKLLKVYEEVGPSIAQFDSHFDPFCIWLGGPPGVGKSTLVDEIIIDLLVNEGIVFDGGNPVFVKSTQTEYWNLYNQQPSVLFDDMLIVQDDETVKQELKDLCTIKSTAPFNAPCAAIGDKKKLVTSKVIAVLSNHYYPKPNFIPEINSVYRRRNVLIVAQKSKWMHDKLAHESLRDPTPEFWMKYKDEVKAKKHLTFGFMDPLTPMETEAIKEWYTYEKLIVYLRRKFSAYYASQYQTLEDRFATPNPLSTSAWYERINNGEVDEDTLTKVKRNLDATTKRHEVMMVTTEELNEAIDRKLNPENWENIPVNPEMPGATTLKEEDASLLLTNREKILGVIERVDIIVSDDDSLQFSEPLDEVCLCPYVKYSEYDVIDKTMVFTISTLIDGELEYHTVEMKPDHLVYCGEGCMRKSMSATESADFLKECLKMHDFNSLDDESLPLLIRGTRPQKPKGFMHRMYSKFGDAFGSLRTSIDNLWRSIPDSIKVLVTGLTAALAAILLYKKVMSVFYPEEKDIILTEDAAGLAARGIKYDYPAHVFDTEEDTVNTQRLNDIGDYMDVSQLIPTNTPAMKTVSLYSESKDPTRKGRKAISKRVKVTRPQQVDDVKKPEPYVRNYGTHGTIKISREQKRNFHFKQYDKDGKQIKAQAADVQLTQDNIAKLRAIIRNTVLLEASYVVKEAGEMVRYGASIRGLGIKGRTIVCPYHFFAHFEGVTPDVMEIELTVVVSDANGFSSYITCDWQSLDWKRVGDYDLAICKLPARIPAFRDISRRFQLNEDEKNMPSKIVVFEQMLDWGGLTYFHIHHVTATRIAESTLDYGENSFQSDLNGYRYPMHGFGVCGSLILNPHTFQIGAMHIAGDKIGAYGYATMVTREMFQHVQEMSADDEFPIIIEEFTKPIAQTGRNVVVVGTTPMKAWQQTKTALAPTPCHGVLTESIRKPCTLGVKGDLYPGQTPLEAGVAKQTSDQNIPFKQSTLVRSKRMLRSLILSNCKPVCATVTSKNTLQDTVCGRDGIPFMSSIRFDSSPGYPYNVMSTGGKNSLIETTLTNGKMELVSLKDPLKKIFDINHAKRVANIIPNTIYQDVLKDEKLPVIKADDPNKTRVINACPLDLLLETRMYCLDFIAAFMNSRFDVMCGIGMNPRGLDWHDLATRLLSKNSEIFDADYSAFGPGLDPQLVDNAFDIINDWYVANGACTEDCEDCRIRKILCHEAAFAHHVVSDSVFQTLKGSPSGHPMTTLINSLVNIQYLMCAWVEICEGKLDDMSFFKHVYACVYGDDLIASVTPNASKYFNAKTFADYMGKHNIKVTPAAKQGWFSSTGLSIYDVTFLKHSFIKHPTRDVYQATLEKGIIEDIPNWYRPKDNKGVPIKTSILELMEQAVSFAYAHGKEYYNQIVKKLENYCIENNMILAIKTWEEYDMQCYEEAYMENDDDYLYNIL